jgi:tetratricopeptide (TPR) repeat protein
MIDRIYGLVQDQKYQEAILEALAYYKSNPADIQALTLYVNLLLNHSFYEKAEETLVQSGLGKASNLNIYLLYRELYSRSGNTVALDKLDHECGSLTQNMGARDYSSSIKKIAYDYHYFSDQILEFTEDLIHLYNQSHSYIKKAYLRAKNGLISDALYYLKEYSNLTKSPSIRYLIRAEIALVEGDYHKSRKMYSHLSNDNTYELQALNRLGDIANALGDNEVAHQYYESAIKLNPDHFNTLIDLLKTAILEGNHNSAKRFYNKIKEEYGEKNIASLKPLLKRKIDRQNAGTVLGLVWSEVTGNILPIEILIEQSGKQNISCTGNVGYLIRDSINTVMNVIGHSDYSQELENTLVNINLPQSSVFKDGPSAGLAILVGIINQLLGHSDLVNHAFTGEISLSGKILPVGGIPEKVFGAYMHGISNIFLPSENHFDLSSIPNTIKESMNFHFVSHYEEIVEQLWTN